MLFFAIPFPMFLYYVINSEFDVNTLKDKDPYFALGIVVLSIILWMALLLGYFQKWVIQVFITKNNLEKIKANGIHREAKILNAHKISKLNSKFPTYELELCFKNLSDTEIRHKTIVTDIKPHERRFEAEKKTGILLDRDMKHAPYFVIASTTASLNGRTFIMRLFGWLFFSALVTGYYFFAYRTESYGMGWRFMSFGHPLIVIPLVLLFYRILVRLIFTKLGGLNNDSVILKFKGIKTQARLVSVNQTGTYINEQPMMRFELEYTDTKNHLHKSSLKKIVGLLELEITRQEMIEIFYNPENPKQIAFASDINNLE